MSPRRAGVALLVVLSGCDGAAVVRSPAAPAQVVKPEAAVAVEPEAPAVAVEPVPAGPPIGWWRGDRTCLELFANGDFELSISGDGPKVLVFGGAQLSAAGGDAFVVELTVAKIWKGRWVSSCRKHNELGGWIDAQEALGVAFVPGAATSLKLRRVGGDAIELCGERCETLRRDTPALTGRWRRAGLEGLPIEEMTWAPGELLELELAGSSSHVWSGVAAARWVTARGPADARWLADDRFVVTFTPTRLVDVPPGLAPTLFGAPLTVEQPRSLTVRRLAGERVEACDGALCSVLERQFDGYNTEVK
jgi:hypothetical protein